MLFFPFQFLKPSRLPSQIKSHCLHAVLMWSDSLAKSKGKQNRKMKVFWWLYVLCGLWSLATEYDLLPSLTDCLELCQDFSVQLLYASLHRQMAQRRAFWSFKLILAGRDAHFWVAILSLMDRDILPPPWPTLRLASLPRSLHLYPSCFSSFVASLFCRSPCCLFSFCYSVLLWIPNQGPRSWISS